MIDEENQLSLTRQCQLLNLNRSTVYYHKTPVSDGDLALMRRIDEMHLDAAVLWQPPHQRLVTGRRSFRGSQACAMLDAVNGHYCVVSQASNEQAGERA